MFAIHYSYEENMKTDKARTNIIQITHHQAHVLLAQITEHKY